MPIIRKVVEMTKTSIIVKEMSRSDVESNDSRDVKSQCNVKNVCSDEKGEEKNGQWN